MDLTSDFLEIDGDYHIFSDDQTLLGFFKWKTFKKKSRQKSSLKEDQGERFALRQFLSTLAASGKLDFPLTVVKTERPDFQLSTNSRDIGIEITQVTTNEVNRDLAISRRTGDNSLIEYTTDGHNVIPPNGRLTSRGFAGYQECERMAKLAQERHEAKLERLNRDGFQYSMSNELLLLENYGLTLELEDSDLVMELREFLVEKCKSINEVTNHDRVFDQVHFIVSNLLFYDILNGCEVLQYPTNA